MLLNLDMKNRAFAPCSKNLLVLLLLMAPLGCVSSNLDNTGVVADNTVEQNTVVSADGQTSIAQNQQAQAQTQTQNQGQAPLFDLRGTKWISSTNNLHTAEFSEDGKITGIAGCNAYQGFYGQSAQGISVTSITLTGNICADSIMLNAKTYASLLQKASQFHQIGKTIVLKDSAGTTLLVMKKQVI